MSLIRSSLLVGTGAAASRILGFIRDILFAQALGAGPVADAFLAAFRVPNLVRRVVGEGGLNPALIPAFGRLEPEQSARFSGDVVAVFTLALLALTGLVELGAGLLALAIVPGLGADQETLDLAAIYTRLGFPSIVGITLASIVAALLNVQRRFAVATLAPLVVNGGLILVLLTLQRSEQPLEDKGIWLAAASSLAGLLQLGIVGAALRHGPARPVRFGRPRWSPALKGVFLAGLPALAASGAAQIFILVGTQVASFWPSGISWIYYAERVMQLPLSLIAALGSSVLLPELTSRHRTGRHEDLIAAQNKAMELALLLSLPACTALVILARPITSTLFERGAFGPDDAAGTAYALAGLSIGLPFAAIGKVISQTLFARGSLRAALAALVLGTAGTGLASFVFGWLFGIPGVAFGVSLGCAAHAAALAGLLRALGLWMPDRTCAAQVLRVALACLILAAGLFAASRLLPPHGVVSLIFHCIGGLVLYGIAAWGLGAVTKQDWRALLDSSRDPS